MSTTTFDPVGQEDLQADDRSSSPPSPLPPIPGRLASIDAYRGLVMFLMMAEVLQLCRVASKMSSNLFFGASTKPLSFKALRPGTETYGLMTAVRLLRAGDLAPSTPLGYFSPYAWSDHRALIEYLRGHTTRQTLVANLLVEHTSAVTSEIPRLTSLPVDSNCLGMYRIPSLVARDTAALETTTEECVVLWDPTCLLGRSTEFSRLFETVRNRFQFEARFGSFEVWRRRPEREQDQPGPHGGWIGDLSRRLNRILKI